MRRQVPQLVKSFPVNVGTQSFGKTTLKTSTKSFIFASYGMTVINS